SSYERACGLHPEPTRAPRRAELRLRLAPLRFRRVIDPGGLGAREEIHVHGGDASAAEFEVAGAGARVEQYLALAKDAPRQRARDGKRRSLGHHAYLRRARERDVADRVDAVEPGLERS